MESGSTASASRRSADWAGSRPDRNKTDRNKPDRSKPDWNKPDRNKPDRNKPDWNKPDWNKPDRNRPDRSKEFGVWRNRRTSHLVTWIGEGASWRHQPSNRGLVDRQASDVVRNG